MSTIILPRVPRTIIRPGGDRKYHTIHFDRYIFTIQKNGTSVVAFRRERDVIRFSKMIESHFDLTHEWPIVNFEDTLLYRNTKSNKLKYINIKEDIKNNEDTFYAFIEEPKIIGQLFLKVSESKDIYVAQSPLKKLFANVYQVLINQSDFSEEVIDKLKLQLWELGGYDTKDMSLSKLAELFVEKISNMKVENVLII